MLEAEPQADSSGNSQADDEKLKELLDVCKRPDNMHPTKTDPVTEDVIEDTDALKQYNLDFINKALANTLFVEQISKTDSANGHVVPADERSKNPRYLIHFTKKNKTKNNNTNITMEEWDDLNKESKDGMAGTKAEALITELSQNCSAIYNQIGTQKIRELDRNDIKKLENISWGASRSPA